MADLRPLLGAFLKPPALQVVRDCVQHENIVLCLYDPNDQPGFLEWDVADFTHAYFPEDKLSDVEIDGRFAPAHHRDTLVAFIGRYPLVYAEGSREDLIQPGKDGYWIFEASTVVDENGRNAFKSRIRQNAVVCKDRTLEVGMVVLALVIQRYKR